MKINDMPPFQRQDGPKHISNIIDSFLTYFQERKYDVIPSVKIHSGLDSTVQFIGSHVSVFKPYMLDKTVPANGIVMSQPCVRTRNLKRYNDDSFYPNWGSTFNSLGLLVQESRLEEATGQTFDLMKDEWGILEDEIVIRVSERDQDLLGLAKKFAPIKFLEIGTMRPEYYRHKLGIDGVWGRNFNIAVRDRVKQTYADVGNVILIENAHGVLGVEIALGTSTVLKQIYGLEHVLSCNPIVGTDTIENKNVRVRIEDCLVTAFMLYHQGLEPSNKHITNRLMKKYVDFLVTSAKAVNLTPESFEHIVTKYELAEYGRNTYTPKLLEYAGVK